MNDMGCGCDGDDDGDANGDYVETRVKMVKNVTSRLQSASMHQGTHVTYFAWSRCPVTSPFTICWRGEGEGVGGELHTRAGARVFKTRFCWQRDTSARIQLCASMPVIW